METRSAFERATELHGALRAYCTVNNTTCRQTISDHGAFCGAANQPAHSLEFRTTIAPGRIDPDSDKYTAFCQGFSAVDIHLTVVWGGCHHDQTPIATPEIRYSVANRLSGGMGTQFWSQSGTEGDDSNNWIDLDAIIPLAQSLLR